MIFDSIKNYRHYAGLGADFLDVFELFHGNSFKKEAGRYEFKNGIFYLVQSYNTKPESEGAFEAHRKYIDIQFISDGRERHNAGHISFMNTSIPYNQEKDIEFFTGSGSTLILHSGFFAVYFPEDVHMPNLQIGDDPEHVIKAVAKIPVK